MNAPVLDTLRCAQTLKAAGFRDEQAEAMAQVLGDALADVVTKRLPCPDTQTFRPTRRRTSPTEPPSRTGLPATPGTSCLTPLSNPLSHHDISRRHPLSRHSEAHLGGDATRTRGHPALRARNTPNATSSAAQKEGNLPRPP